MAVLKSSRVKSRVDKKTLKSSQVKSSLIWLDLTWFKSFFDLTCPSLEHNSILYFYPILFLLNRKFWNVDVLLCSWTTKITKISHQHIKNNYMWQLLYLLCLCTFLTKITCSCFLFYHFIPISVNFSFETSRSIFKLFCWL